MFPTIDRQRTGERILKIMKQQNITVKQIQEYLNLSCVQGIYHWLDGTSMPTMDNLYALCELFEVPMDYLDIYEGDVDNYWKATAANAMRSLYKLIALAKMVKTGLVVKLGQACATKYVNAKYLKKE